MRKDKISLISQLISSLLRTLSHWLQSEIPKVEKKLRILLAFPTLNLGLRIESNWDIKGERTAKRFKEHKQIQKKEKKQLLTLGKAKGYMRKSVFS